MSSTNTWATLPSGKTLKLANPHHMSPAVGKVELDRLSGLLRWWKASNGRADVASIGAETDNRSTSGGSEEQGGRHGNLTFNEVREGMFFDAAFKVNEPLTDLQPSRAFSAAILTLLTRSCTSLPTPHPARRSSFTSLTVPSHPNQLATFTMSTSPSHPVPSSHSRSRTFPQCPNGISLRSVTS